MIKLHFISQIIINFKIRKYNFFYINNFIQQGYINVKLFINVLLTEGSYKNIKHRIFTIDNNKKCFLSSKSC